MAIISCSECSKDISDKALTCPHCGTPIKANENKKINNIALTVVLVIVAGWVLYFGFDWYWQYTHPKEDPARARMQKSSEELDRILKNSK